MLKIGRVSLSMAEATASAPDQSRARPWEDIHTHLCITLEGRGPRPYSSRISFVELAPPEPRDDPAARSSAGALRNKMVGFSSLQSVITALQVATAKARAGKALAHIPWRDSPLTRWLKEPLFSAASVLLLSTVSSAVEAAPDTLATMTWASRLRPSNRAKVRRPLRACAYEAPFPSATFGYSFRTREEKAAWMTVMLHVTSSKMTTFSLE